MSLSNSKDSSAVSKSLYTDMVVSVSSTGVKSLKKPRKVLDEETFIDKLESIIERDFFPDLEKLKLQQAYYEALKNDDLEAVREIYLKYNETRTQERNQAGDNTPKFFDTPIIQSKNKHEKAAEKETPYANEEPPKNKQNNLSLDQFLSKNTSEDNVSFEVLMAEWEKKEKAKVHQSWLYEKEQKYKQKNEISMMLEDGGLKTDDSVTKSIDCWKYTSKNTLMYIPEGVPLNDQEKMDRVKLAVPKITHTNTRLLPGTFSTSDRAKTDTNTNDDPSFKSIAKLGVDGKEMNTRDTPQVKGYKFVDASPSPMPGRNGDESPMMTWGEIDSTPFRLDGNNTPYSRGVGGPEFKIPDVPEREKIALGLEEKASAARRKRKHEALEYVQRSLASPSRSGSSIEDKMNNMSPAAKRLLSSKIQLKSPINNMRPSTSSSPSPFFTPSPYADKSSKSPFLGQMSSPIIKSSPIENLRSTVRNKKSSSTDSLTDGLLKLPKISNFK